MFGKKTYTDKELVAGCIRNNRQCQEILYKRYFPSMMAMCMRHTRDQEISKDIINRGFLKVFLKIDTYSFKGSLAAWIRRIVYHCMSDHFRKNSKYLQFLVFEEREERVEAQPLEDMYVKDLMKIVDKLPFKTGIVFQLFAIEGLSHKEIAQQENISVGTSKWHLNKARELLKSYLRENDNYKNYAG